MGKKGNCKSRGGLTAWSVGVIGCLLLVGVLAPAPAAAQSGGNSCIKEELGGNPSCSANDVRIASLSVAAGGPTSCVEGESVIVTLEALIESTAEKYGIGIWLNESGGSAQSDPTGTCYRDFLQPVSSGNADCNSTLGPFYDGDGDACGDLDAQGTGPCGTDVTGPCSEGGGTCLFTTYQFTTTLLCNDSNNDGTADVGSCTSWKQNPDGACTDELGTDPGNGSKCDCSIAEVIGLQTGCASDAECDDDVFCNGSETCNLITGDCDPGTPPDCGFQTTECTLGVCDETADQCVPQPFAQGTSCGDGTDTDCDNPDTCDGLGSCEVNNEPSTTVCRTAAGVCDVAEQCDGAGSCPGDSFVTGGTECRASADVCDVAEDCTGSSAACPADGFDTGTECRATAGVCDVPEDCDGSGVSCPADGFDTGTECRATAGVCDVPEDCDGSGVSCPADGFDTGTECRATAGVCDVPEDCDGSGVSCPEDGKSTSLCRAALDVCDATEFCDGTNNDCPANGVLPSTTVCRAGAVCDPEELCNGTDITCPSDVVSGEGDPCGDPTSNACTLADTCDSLGVCLPNNLACSAVTDSALCSFDFSTKRGCVDGSGTPTGQPCDVVTGLVAPASDGLSCSDVGAVSCQPESQFRLLFTPDGKLWPAHKANATNPGQFYYNLISDGSTIGLCDNDNSPCDTSVPNDCGDNNACVQACAGKLETFTISVPYPFITHGARPVHVYDGSLVTTDPFCVDDQTLEVTGACDFVTFDSTGCPAGESCDQQCFIPPEVALAALDRELEIGNWFDAPAPIIDWSCPTFNQSVVNNMGTCTLTVTATYPASCQLYVNIHLDFGLKGVHVDWNPGDGKPDRYDPDVATLSDWGSYDALVDESQMFAAGSLGIPDCKDLDFSHTTAFAGEGFGGKVQNLNIFKRPSGCFGLASTSSDGEGVTGATLSLVHPTDGVVLTAETDEDGYYLLEYKHKGKPTLYTVTLTTQDGTVLSGQVTLKGNGFAEVNFDLTMGTVEVVKDGSKTGSRGKASRAR